MSLNPIRDEPFGPAAAELVCHPDAPCPAVSHIQARVSLLDAGLLSLGFTVTGNLDDLAIPRIEPPARVDRLWEHTCFEAFLAVPGTEGYLELNVAPSTAWAAYTFQRYREHGKPAEGLNLRVVVHQKPDRLELHALLHLDQAIAGKLLRLGLSAVIERKDGILSYWALKHPAGRPDFHNPQAFALELITGLTP